MGSGTRTTDEQWLRDELRRYAEAIAPEFALPDIIARAHGQFTEIGVTGTRHELPELQVIALTRLIADIAGASRIMNERALSLHHGCAIGTDEFTHGLVREFPGAVIHGHPGHDRNGRSPYRMRGFQNSHTFDYLYPPKPYRDRNSDIIEASRLLVAVPQFPENHPQSQRSGTWMTIRMARGAGKYILMVDADGKIDVWSPRRNGESHVSIP